MKKEKLKGSFHGHSIYSDGTDQVSTLVRAAVESKFNYFALSDHDTTEGITIFYDEIAKANDEGAEITPVMAMEHTSKEGHVVLAKPGEIDHEYLAWLSSLKVGKENIKDVLNYNAKQFEAFAIIAHPNCPFIDSVSTVVVKELAQSLDSGVKSHVGLEVNNWVARLMLGYNFVREAWVRLIAEKYGFAQFGSTDYHEAWHIKKQWTNIDAKDSSPASLINAIKAKNVESSGAPPVDPLTFAHLVYSFFKVH